MTGAASLPRRKTGSQGLEVSAIGLGCRSLSSQHERFVEEKDALEVFRCAFDNGVIFFDTSDIYGIDSSNEKLLGVALKEILVPREKVQLATKFERAGAHSGTAEYVREACESSLERLSVDYIDLLFQHRVDPTVPIEVTVREMKKLIDEGKIKYIGLSDASADTIRRAHAVHPIAAVQIEWSLWTRDVENDIIPLCKELGIGVVCYSPLGRGFFAGKAIDTRYNCFRYYCNANPFNDRPSTIRCCISRHFGSSDISGLQNAHCSSFSSETLMSVCEDRYLRTSSFSWSIMVSDLEWGFVPGVRVRPRFPI